MTRIDDRFNYANCLGLARWKVEAYHVGERQLRW